MREKFRDIVTATDRFEWVNEAKVSAATCHIILLTAVYSSVLQQSMLQVRSAAAMSSPPLVNLSLLLAVGCLKQRVGLDILPTSLQ